MVSQAEIDRLRREADTIMTRLDDIESALQEARHESGADWETGTLELRLESPRGEIVEVTFPLDCDPAREAQSRYEHIKELESRLERKQQVVDQLEPMPAEPLAYLVCYHLDTVEGNYPKSMAGHLAAERGAVETLCERMEATGILERVESGTVKQRRVKAKQADEVRQHHTYYRLSREGDHLLRFLSTEDGKQNVLLHLPEGREIVERIHQNGPRSPRMTAEETGMAFEHARHLYRALLRVGVLAKTDSVGPDGQRTDSGSADHTYYDTTATASRLLEAES